jgi:hypothetical protein
LNDLLADPTALGVLRAHVPQLVDGPLRSIAGHLSLVEIAAFAVGILPKRRLGEVAAALAPAGGAG